MTGSKFYYQWQVDASSLIHPDRLILSKYRNNMGAGLVNAGALLDAIDNGAGEPMKFPNIYVKAGSKVAVNPSAYLDGTSFTIEISDKSIVSMTKNEQNGIFTFEGLKSGFTSATISWGETSQSFVITVSTSDSASGWL